MHQIRFVDDAALPEGHDFVLIQAPSGSAIFYRASAVTPQVLEDSWAACRSLQTAHPRHPDDVRRIA